MGEDEITEDYFISRIRQYEAYLGYSLLNPRGFYQSIIKNSF